MQRHQITNVHSFIFGRFIFLYFPFYFLLPLNEIQTKPKNAGQIVPVIAHEMYLAHNRRIIFKINSPFAQREMHST